LIFNTIIYEKLQYQMKIFPVSLISQWTITVVILSKIEVLQFLDKRNHLRIQNSF
jgi:hypothetical protein